MTFTDQSTSKTVAVPGFLSPSSVSAWENCPLAWKFRYIDKIRTPRTWEQIVGSIVHRVIELVCGLPAAERTLEAARVQARAAWNEFEQDEQDRAVIPTEEDRATRWAIWEHVVNWFAVEDPAKIRVAGAEQWVTGTIGGVPIRGIIDRWERDTDGRAVITDYKTGQVPSARFVPERFSAMWIYAELLRQAGEDPGHVRLVYTRDRTVITRPVTAGTLAESRERVTRVDLGIRSACASGVFTPRPSKLCDWCAYKPMCPVWSGKPEGAGDERW